MSTRRRRSPRRHTVHTRHPRYSINTYKRGLETRDGVTKTRHAWAIDDALRASPVYDKATPEWRSDHNRSDVRNIDYPDAGYRMLKRDLASNKRRLRETRDRRSKLVRAIKARGRRPTASETQRINGMDESIGVYKSEIQKLEKKLGKADKKKKKETFDPVKFPHRRSNFGDGQAYHISEESLTKKQSQNLSNRFKRLGIRHNPVWNANTGSYVMYVHEAEYKLRSKEVLPSNASKETLQRFKDKNKMLFLRDPPVPFKGLLMNEDRTIGLVVDDKELWKNVGVSPYKGQRGTFVNLDKPIIASVEHIKLRSVKGKKVGGAEYEQLCVGNVAVDAKKLREVIRYLGQDNLVFRAEEKDYPVVVHNAKGDTVFLAPLIGMTTSTEFKGLPRLRNIEGVHTAI